MLVREGNELVQGSLMIPKYQSFSLQVASNHNGKLLPCVMAVGAIGSAYSLSGVPAGSVSKKATSEVLFLQLLDQSTVRKAYMLL